MIWRWTASPVEAGTTDFYSKPANRFRLEIRDLQSYRFYSRRGSRHKCISFIFELIIQHTSQPVFRTLCNTLPKTPLTLVWSVCAAVITTAALIAKARCSFHLFSGRYLRGNQVAAARGSTKSTISRRFLDSSTKMLNPQSRHALRTHRPESHICGVTVFGEKSFGPRRVRDRHTP